jgi:hypothetical protein
MKKNVFYLFLATALLLFLTSCSKNDDIPTAQTGSEPRPTNDVASEQELVNNHETTVVRFYYHCKEADPHFDFFPEAYLYISEEISTERFREEFIRLMYTHTRINIAY